MDRDGLKKISRRSVLKAAGIAAAAPLLPGWRAEAQGSFNWRKYQGTTLRILVDRVTPCELLAERIPQFEAKTGIKMKVELYPEELFRQKTVVEMTSGTSDLDLFVTLIGNEGVKFYKSGWYEPVKRYVDDKALTDPAWDPADILPGAWETAKVDTALVSVPIEVDCHMLISNKLLVERAGIAPPKTMAELEAAAKKITKKDAGIYGVALRGRRATSAGVFANVLYSMGGTWLDKQGNPALNTPEAVAAFELWGRLLREYGPPGAVNHHFTEVNSLLMAGKVGLTIEASIFASLYEDPEKSKIAGQVGYHLIPAGPGGSRPVIAGWGVAMYAKSTKKEAAWAFMQWASGKDVLMDIAIAGQGSPRTSVWNSAKYKSATRVPRDWQETLVQSLKVGNPFLVPPVIPIGQVRDIVGDVIHASLTGGNVKEAANKANELFKKALEEAG
jgi:multiple sugar transport system substrate-binding protein